MRFVLLFVWVILIALPASAYSQTGDQREIFANAYALYSSGKSGAAQELFRKTVNADFRLADYSLYYLAVIAFDEANWNQSRQRLSQLKQRFPQSLWSQPAALLQAKIEIAEKNYTQANEILRQLRVEKSTKREIADEALSLQAQIRESQGEPQRAHALYDELRNLSPNSRWIAAARKAQARLRDKYAELFPFHTTQSLSDEADRLVRERQTGEAEILYKKLLNSAADPESRLRFLSKLADLYLSVRNRNEAMPLLEQIARDYPDNIEAPKALFQIGQILWNRHDNAQALEYFKLVLDKYPSSSYVDRVQYAAADIHEHFGRKDDAVQMYGTIVKQFPNSPVRDDAHWRLAWLYYRGGDLASAAATFKSLASQSKNVSLGAAALYWQARSAEKSGERETAKQLYRQAVNTGTESYYQDLAFRGLERLGESLGEPAVEKPFPVTQAEPVSGEFDFHLTRARELAALSLHHLAIAELDEVNAKTKPNGRLRMILLREYFRSHAYGRSLNIANQAALSQSERNFYRYPLAFWELIQQKAEEREVDPYLVLALIRQ